MNTLTIVLPILLLLGLGKFLSVKKIVSAEAITGMKTLISSVMLYISLWLTLIVVAAVWFILKVVGRIAGETGKWFGTQQQTLGDLDGYVEEMVNGQKVIKVFNYEERNKAEFRKKNDACPLSWCPSG